MPKKIAKVCPDRLHESNLRHIRIEDVRVAYLYLIRYAQLLAGYECYPAMKGEVRDFRYYVGEEQPFAFIVNAESLLFYFRKPSLARFSVQQIERSLSDVRVPREHEVTVRVTDRSSAERVMGFAFGFSEA